MFDDLMHRYAEAHRHYHDTRHLAEVMSVIDRLEPHAEDIEAVRLAAWFHDAIYDPTRADNEERSAALAQAELGAIGLPGPQLHEVVRLVRLTRDHDPSSGDRNGELLCDADLSIFGADPDRYAAYAAGVRAEYDHVDDVAFSAARAKVLETLLARPVLFRTAAARESWEETARHNLTQELSALTSRRGGASA
jgi:Uncharacterized protein conserved in bacteria